MFDAATAVALARNSNDQLAAAIAKYPTRFTGLAAVAPQNPREAAKELERGVRTLGLKGRKVSDYMRENVYVTSSGMAWAPAIQFCQQVLGEDRVMYAMDYPYQFEAAEVAAMDHAGTDAARAKFYELSARTVFGIQVCRSPASENRTDGQLVPNWL